MVKITKEIYTGIVRYNGNHYFSGDWVKGPRVFGKDERVFLKDISEDQYGNEFICTVEIFPESLQLIKEEK